MKTLRMLVTCLAIGMFGCANEHTSELDKLFNLENTVSDRHLNLTSKGFIEIPIDSTALNYSAYPIHYANDTCEYYISANEFLNAIEFYDLRKKHLVKRNTFSSDGPDGIYSVRCSFVKSLDSIYIFSADDRKIFLTTFNGKILQKYNATKSWMAHLLGNFTVIHDNGYFPYMTFGDNRQQVGHRSLMKQDLISGEFEEIGPEYPTVYDSGIFYSFLPFYAFGHNNNIVVRFGSLTTLYNYDIETGVTKTFQMKSKYQKQPVLPDYKVKEFRELDHDLGELEQDGYLGIIYDKFNHVYYSIFQQGIPRLDQQGNKNQNIIDKPFSVIIFDEDFKYCGETLLDAHTYQNNFIPTTMGLLACTGNPKNPKNNENILRFEIFHLGKTEE